MEEIKSEFKIQSMVDLHQKLAHDGKISIQTSGMECDVCRVPSKSIESFCANCGEFICADCSRAHRGSKASRTHKLTPYTKMYSEKKDQFNHEMRKLEERMAELSTAIEDNTTAMNNIPENDKQLISHVNEAREDIKTQVDLHHDKLIQDIKTFSEKKEKSLQQNNVGMKRMKEKLEETMNFLYNISSCQDYVLITDTIENMQRDTKEQSRKMQIQIQNAQACIHSALSVQTVPKWDPAVSTKLQRIKTSPKSSQVGEEKPLQDLGTTVTLPDNGDTHEKSQQMNQLSTAESAQCEKVIHDKYKQVSRQKIQVSPCKLCYFRGEIWCAAHDEGIIVYNAKCKQVKHIKHKLLADVLSIAKTLVGDIVVDKVNGLLFFKNSDYEIQNVSVIDQPGFADAAIVGNQLFALHILNHKVYIFSFEHDTWVKQKEVGLANPICSWDDTICANNSGFYVCSFRSSRISIYDIGGTVISETVMYGKPEQPINAYICDVDHHGNLLVCDSDNNRLVMSSCTGWRWKVVLSPQSPVCAVMTDCNIWVGTEPVEGANKLLRYEKAN